MAFNFKDKAQEIAYALMRVAVYIRRRDFRARIEDMALRLLGDISEDDFEVAIKTIDAAVEFIRLGVSIYEIEVINARTLIEELSGLNSAIKQAYGFEALPEPGSFFSDSLNAAMRHISNRQSLNNTANSSMVESGFDNAAITGSKTSAINEAVVTSEEESSGLSSVSSTKIDAQNGMVSIGATIRQTAILNKIRSMTIKNPDGTMAGCRMRDLITAFPNVSERTLRNDLQRLAGQDIVQRIGNGGPASYYIVK